ncbi:unnamed protein product [Gordionus sp. m RMFG-2023]
MDKLGANVNINPSTNDIQNSYSLHKNKAPKMKCNKTLFRKPPISLQKRMLLQTMTISHMLNMALNFGITLRI